MIFWELAQDEGTADSGYCEVQDKPTCQVSHWLDDVLLNDIGNEENWSHNYLDAGLYDAHNHIPPSYDGGCCLFS